MKPFDEEFSQPGAVQVWAFIWGSGWLVFAFLTALVTFLSSPADRGDGFELAATFALIALPGWILNSYLARVPH